MKKNRGVAVILAIFFMMLLSLIGVALIGIVPVELRSATRNKLDLQAHYAATSGIRHAKEWCSAVMTPVTASEASPNALGDPIGIGVGTSGGSNPFYPTGGSFHNEITGVDGANDNVEYTPMRLESVWASNLIPHTMTRWSGIHQMLNIPAGGPNTVHGKTVVLVKKTPLTMGNWSVYTVIVPDQNSPGGINTLDAGDNYLIKGSFGGSGQAGRRAYQIISLGYYQGYPTIRAKSTILEDSFARYSLFVDEDPSNSWVLQGVKDQITTQGPVHTNGSFRFALESDVWTSTVSPFNGLMTHARNGATTDGIHANFIGKDGNRYDQGNDERGTSQDYRPFDDSGAEYGDRYNKLMGGKGNLRLTGKVSLPPDSTKIANAAYGTNYQTNHYGAGAPISHFVTDGGAPDGLFVFPNATSGLAAGGIVVKNDQRRMFLEVVDQNGVPVVNQSALEAGTGTSTLNPAIRVQAATSRTAGSTSTGITVSTGTTTGTTVVTTGSTTGLSSSWTTITTGSTTGTSLSTRTLFATSTITGTSVSTRTLFGTTTLTSTGTSLVTTSFSTGTSVSTRLTTSSFSTGQTVTTTGYTTIGGAGGVVQALTSIRILYSTTTITNLSTRTLYSTSISTRTTSSTRVTSSSTGTSLSTRTTTRTTSSSTGTSISTRTTTRPLTTSTLTTLTTSIPLTSTSTSTAYGTTTITTTSVIDAATWFPIDQVIEAKNVGVTLSPSMFRSTALSNYSRAAGAVGSANDMDVTGLASVETLLQLSNGTLTTLAGPATYGVNNIVVIKQSRTNPKEAIVTVIPAVPDQEGKLLNGAVLTEGNIGDPTTGGLAGVNMGRRTIGGQIDPDSTATEATTEATNLGYRSNKDSSFVGIGNNVWQFGTRLVETDPHLLRADNGLGLVAEDVRINADPNDFSAWDGRGVINMTTSSLLNLHMVILAGSNNDGGLTVRGYKNIDDLTPTNMGTTGPGQTPVIRFLGGLILRNYYARINGVTGAGWNSKNIYNQQLALVPPPYFPNNGLLVPLSYVEERIWGEQRY